MYPLKSCFPLHTSSVISLSFLTHSLSHLHAMPPAFLSQLSCYPSYFCFTFTSCFCFLPLWLWFFPPVPSLCFSSSSLSFWTSFFCRPLQKLTFCHSFALHDTLKRVISSNNRLIYRQAWQVFSFLRTVWNQANIKEDRWVNHLCSPSRDHFKLEKLRIFIWKKHRMPETQCILILYWTVTLCLFLYTKRIFAP